jgi:hypothetical protein
MLGTDPPSALIFRIGAGGTGCTCSAGFAVFQAMERNFADVI